MRTKPTGPLVSPMKTDLTPAQAAKMSEWTREDLAAGKITQTQADAIFNDLSTPAGQRASDTRSADERQFDAAFPVAQEKDFTIRYGNPGQESTMTPKLQQADTRFRTWLGPRGMGLPRENGNALVNAVTKTVQETQHMTPAQLDEFGEREMRKLRGLYGDQLETKLKKTAIMLRALEQTQPGVMNLLRSNGIGDAARVVTQLVNHYEIWAARQR